MNMTRKDHLTDCRQHLEMVQVRLLPVKKDLVDTVSERLANEIAPAKPPPMSEGPLSGLQRFIEQGENLPKIVHNEVSDLESLLIVHDDSCEFSDDEDD